MCSTERRKSYTPRMAWRWVIFGIIFIFGWTIPLSWQLLYLFFWGCIKCPIQWANNTFANRFNKFIWFIKINNFWITSLRLLNVQPGIPQGWSVGPVSELNPSHTLGSKLSLSCSDLMNHRCSEALMCHIILPLLVLSFPSLSHSLSLLLSSLSLLPGASCASSHILLTFTPFVYSLNFSLIIFSLILLFSPH